MDMTETKGATGESAEAAVEAAIWEALGGVIDPEVGVDVVTLGLVYRVEVLEGLVEIDFTLTTPNCPMEDVIRIGIQSAAAAAAGGREVDAVVVWEPAWNPTRIKEGTW
jgi:metal-sulfur cluster biosynthetic enzyme